MQSKYKRVLLKLSGESLTGDASFGIDPNIVNRYARDIKSIVDLGVEVAIVIGGGNIYRGMNESETGIERAHGDYMGMLATVINGMAVQAMLERDVALARLGTPRDVAKLVTYLASPLTDFATGAIWTLDGGQVHS